MNKISSGRLSISLLFSTDIFWNSLILVLPFPLRKSNWIKFLEFEVSWLKNELMTTPMPNNQPFQLLYSDWKLSKGNGYWTKTVHFWPYVGKAKMCLRVGIFLWLLEFSLQFSAFCLQFFKKSTAYPTHLDFTNIGSEEHRFSFTCYSQFDNFQSQHPVYCTEWNLL